MGADRVKAQLVSTDAVTTVLKLSVAIYPIGSWLYASPAGGTSADDVLESWNLRATSCSWALRAIEELRGDEEQRKFSETVTGMTSD